MNQLIGLQPTENCIVYWDGCDRKFFPYQDYSQQVRNCFVGADITSFLTSSDFSISIGPGTIGVGNIDTLISLSLIGNNLFVAGIGIDMSPYYSNFMFNIFDGYNGFPVSMGTTITLKSASGIHFNVSAPDTISIGLPTPDATYFTPGRCTPQLSTIASYTGKVRWMASDITISALNPGYLGNAVLLFDGIKTVAQAIAERNLTHPTNQIALTAGIDTDIPINKEEIHLSGGQNGISCLPTDYFAHNKWLVLTRDNCHQQAVWLPP